MSRIFISYSRQDATFTRRLAADLSTLGADIWIDVDDIPAGMKWSTAIQQGLKSCEVLIVIISPDSMGSRNVEDEWQYYLDDGKPVIPVLLHPADVHFQLRRVQYINFHTQDYTTALYELREELARNGVRLKPLPVDMVGAAQPPSAQGPLHPPYGAPPSRTSTPAPASIPVKVVAAGVATIALVVVLLALALLIGLPALTGDGGDTPVAQVATATATFAATDTATVPPTSTPTTVPAATATTPPTATQTHPPTPTSALITTPDAKGTPAAAIPLTPGEDAAFFLAPPVDRELVIVDPFNTPRDYSFAPDKIQALASVKLAAVDSDGNPVTILAAQRGTVDKVSYSAQGTDAFIRIAHTWGDNSYVTWYGNLSEVYVEEGQVVTVGEPIALAGTTSDTSGTYLMFTLQHLGAGLDNYIIDDVVDPAPYFVLDWHFDDAAFVEDITIPDGTAMQCGTIFTKTWRIRNIGTSTWNKDYALVSVEGDPMGNPDGLPILTGEVAPSEVVDIAVTLVAPFTTGVHRSLWQLQNDVGDLVPSFYLYVEIEVLEGCAKN